MSVPIATATVGLTRVSPPETFTSFTPQAIDAMASTAHHALQTLDWRIYFFHIFPCFAVITCDTSTQKIAKWRTSGDHAWENHSHCAVDETSLQHAHGLVMWGFPKIGLP